MTTATQSRAARRVPTAAATPGRRPRYQRPSVPLTIVLAVMTLYTIIPLVYLIVSSTKTSGDFFTTFGLAFGTTMHLPQNIAAVFTYDGGVYGRWFLNTILYVVVGGMGSAVISTFAGYGLAKYAFVGRKAFFAVVLGAVAIPGTALALPTFLLFSAVGLTDNPLAVIIPTLVNPFGLYLMWIYSTDSVPTELLEAARIDGAGEFRTFRTISIKLLSPAFVTVLLFSIVATWNNYFLPLVMLSDPKWYPLTVGLSQWNAQSTGTNAQPIQNLIMTGSLLAIVPIVVAFLFLQRYWQSGLAAGSVKS